MQTCESIRYDNVNSANICTVCILSSGNNTGGRPIWLRAHCLIVTCWQRRSNATVTADSINLESEFTGNSRARREEQFVKYTPRRIPNGNARLQAYLFTDRAKPREIYSIQWTFRSNVHAYQYNHNRACGCIYAVSAHSNVNINTREHRKSSNKRLHGK